MLPRRQFDLWWVVLLSIIHLIGIILLSPRRVLAQIYTDDWVIEVSEDMGQQQIENLARRHGFVNMGPVFDNYYLFRQQAGRKKRSADEIDALANDPKVRWAEQQVAKKRVKRSAIPEPQPHEYYQSSNYYSSRRGSKNYGTSKSSGNKMALEMNFNDPQWSHMWYLNRGNGRDMNVKKAWEENLTGQGIVVTILDDGLEKDHPDIKRNYDPAASYDVNSLDDDPEPRYDMADSNRHGTRCAGEVAAMGNNSICAVGVAFNARVGGVRMLDGLVTDAVEAKSLRLNQQHIDIYSVSWGPDDDGKTVDGPGPLATKAFMDGVTHGRGGRGSIFVWASGNGGREHDNCNCDGYTNSIWTLSISSASENGDVPWYSEACSSTLASTYSSGSTSERQVVTTDLHHGCTQSHTGTSASAPLAAGICALSLEANYDLTWRDLQHIVVRTARPENLNAPDWQVNGVGRNVSHSFGYGMMDAYAMVKSARTWRRVPPQQTCHIPATHFNKKIPAKSQVNLALEIKPSDCPNINYLEHVQAKITLRASRRGDIEIYLTSSAGTRSTLLALRPQDTSHAGFTDWPFMSVHSWGENPYGFWQLEIHNEGRYLGRADLVDWSLILYGTKQNPDTYVPSPHELVNDINEPKFDDLTPIDNSIFRLSTKVFHHGDRSGLGVPSPGMPTLDRDGDSRSQVNNKQSPSRSEATLEKWDLVLYGTETNPTGATHDVPSEIRDNNLPEDRRFGDGGGDPSTNADGAGDDPYGGEFRFPDPPHNPSDFSGQVHSAASISGLCASNTCLCIVVFICRLFTQFLRR